MVPFVFIINNISSILKRAVTKGVIVTDRKRFDDYENQKLSDVPLLGLLPGHFKY